MIFNQSFTSERKKCNAQIVVSICSSWLVAISTLLCSVLRKFRLNSISQANTNTLALAASHEIVELDVSGITDADNSSTRGWNDKPRKT